VTEINKDTNGTYTIRTGTLDLTGKKYDLVVIASPLSITDISFTGGLEHLNRYKNTPKANPIYVTIVEGEFNEDFFKTNSFPKIIMPNQRLTSAKIGTIFNFGKIKRVHSIGKINKDELEK